MNPTAVVTAFMMALQAKDFDAAASYLSEDFEFSGYTPRPLNKQQFFIVMSELMSGLPNLAFNMHDVTELDETALGKRVQAAMQLRGTQTDSFQLPPLGLPIIPPLGKSVSLPEEHWEYVIRDSTIIRITVERAPGGGIPGLLHQLGVDVPIIQ